MNTNPAVLYVEDDPKSRKVMGLFLKMTMGFSRVTIFEDSTDFPERIQALDPKPDIIFLDIHMKPYTGFDMLTMLRQNESFDDVPVVALTASVMNEEVHMLQTAGFDGCFAKPLDIDTFPDNLNRILNGEHIWRIL